MVSPWSLINTRVEIENRIFTLKTDTRRSPRTGKEHDFYVLEAGDWVNVLPVTPSGDVLFVRQYRVGTQEVTLEIPGGLVEDGQTPEEAAARELLEETGYAAPNLTFLGRVRPNPAILTNWCYSFLAENAVPAGEKQLDDAEDLETVRFKMEDIPGLIADGRIDHALVITAFFYYFSSHLKKV